MGPLQGVKIVEVGGLGATPFSAMMLADMGAEILHIDRSGRMAYVDPKYDLLHRGRTTIIIDLKKPEGVEAVLKLVERVDALQEGFRPGVMEDLGLGPDICLKRNPKLVYGRLTGWGQSGPLSHAAGHDINYIALSGALHSFGRIGQKPNAPLNLVGDFGGGGLLLAFGMVCALLEAQKSGKGQVVDAAMVDGASVLMSLIYGLRAAGLWTDTPGENLLDGGAPFYDTYETRDGKYVAVGAIEPQFYALLLEKTGLNDPDPSKQRVPLNWPELKVKLAEIFKQKTRDEWCDIMEGTDACFAPVLSLVEAPQHPHNIDRSTFIEYEGVIQPAPAPRFSRTRPEIQGLSRVEKEKPEIVLRKWGFNNKEIDDLKKTGAI